MLKRFLIIVCLSVPGTFAWSQDSKPDSLFLLEDTSMSLSIDTSLDYDELFNELDLFLDSILAPRSYAVLSLSAGQAFLSFATRNTRRIRQVKKIIWSPSFGYYNKNGLGVTITGFMVDDSVKLNTYQFSISPSYDYIKNRDLATGVSFTRYVTKRSLPFYTSPLQNELIGYFLWRKSWLQPGIMANYGWGSRTQFIKKDSIYYKNLLTAATTNNVIRDKDTVTIFRRNTKSIVDFSVSVSLRHDFYWLDIFSHKDHIRVSPVLSLSGGTQKFGFNQTTGASGPLRVASLLNNTQNVSLQQKFQVLSLDLYLRAEYSIGKFFVQPQMLFDYYFPAASDNFMVAFSVNTGFMF